MTETAATFLDPEIPTITDLGTGRPKNIWRDDLPRKNNTDEAICPKLNKKDVYESDMHKIYNLIVVQTNEQL